MIRDPHHTDAHGTHRLDAQGSLPGLQLEPVYDTLSLEFKAGWYLLLFGDGLFEGSTQAPRSQCARFVT
jgi:serine phosphatase RsbU (regulator of sigma subunit)